MKLVDREKIQRALKESVLALCQSSVDYDAELIVEGLLGITLDKKEIILIKINEVIKQEGPKDLSIPKRSSEKRKADVDILNNNNPPSLVLHYPSKKTKVSAHNPLRQNLGLSSKVSQRGDSMGSTLPSSSATLRMPIIPPEYVQNQFNRYGRNNEINSMAEKHSEISRILGSMNVPVLNIVPQTEEDNKGVNLSQIKREKGAATYMPAYEGVDESSNLIIVEDDSHKTYQSDIQKLQMNNVKVQSYFSPYMKPAMVSTGSWVSTSTKSPASGTYNSTAKSAVSTGTGTSTNQTIGVVLDTNVQPPTPLAVVSGTGMLQRENSGMKSGPCDPSPSGGHAYTQDIKKEESVSPKEAGKSVRKTPTSGGRGSKEFRRFRCTMCPASSSRKFNLQRHMKSHHPGYSDCYIVDLTPKERGHSDGDMAYTPRIIGCHNEDSNDNSSQAMDLSSAGLENWYGTTEEKVSPSSSFANSSLAISSVDLSPQNKESVTSGSGNSGSESSSKKVSERMSKPSKDGSSSGKIRKGLDQVLFSKFGCYTNVQSEMNGPVKSEKLDNNDGVGNASVFPGLVPLPMPEQLYFQNTNEESKIFNGISNVAQETLPFSPAVDKANEEILSPRKDEEKIDEDILSPRKDEEEDILSPRKDREEIDEEILSPRKDREEIDEEILSPRKDREEIDEALPIQPDVSKDQLEGTESNSNDVAGHFFSQKPKSVNFDETKDEEESQGVAGVKDNRISPRMKDRIPAAISKFLLDGGIQMTPSHEVIRSENSQNEDVDALVESSDVGISGADSCPDVEKVTSESSENQNIYQSSEDTEQNIDNNELGFGIDEDISTVIEEQEPTNKDHELLTLGEDEELLHNSENPKDAGEMNGNLDDSFSECMDTTSMTDDIDATEQLGDFELHEDDTDEEGLNDMEGIDYLVSINDENANEDTLSKQKVLHSVRKKSTELYQKARISP